MDPRRVLVVDDDYHTRRMLCRLLSARGLAPSGVSTAPEALAYIQAAPPAVVLLDVHMPGVDGIQLFKALSLSPKTKHLPILLMTGLPVPSSLIHAAADGLRVGRIYEKAELDALLDRAEELLDAPSLPPNAVALDLLHRTLQIGDCRIAGLAAKRFDVLVALLRHDGSMTQEDLLMEVWGPDHDPKTVQMTVARLREDLKPYPALQILTESRSYRLLIHPSPRRR